MACSPFIATHAQLNGRVFDDRNNNGVFDRADRPMANVAVTDGLNVVMTDAKGRFTLPGHDRQRFVSVSSPSGYRPVKNHYLRIDPATADYDFAMTRYNNGAASDGSHRFIQVTDTEIFNTEGNEAWVDDVRRYAANEQAAFVVHTGDICYKNGLTEHIKLMNSDNMGLPVYYCLGNHDLVDGAYGEEFFENIYGPVWYSFNAGGTHYVVTPMPGGDRRPSYTADDVARWLRNDLSVLPEGTPVCVFNHDILTYGNDFTIKGKTDSIRLNDHNLKAWIYGHWHINHQLRQGDVVTICTSTPDKGGIDHSTSAYRVVNVDKKGDITTDLRYSYIHDHAAIASPKGTTGCNILTVNTYSSHSPASAVSCTLAEGNKILARNIKLRQATDWTWTAQLPLKESYTGKTLTATVTTRFKSGATARCEQTFTYMPATEAAKADTLPRLMWTANAGANIYMTSPLIHDGKVFTATTDEDLKGDAAIVAFDAATGAEAWRRPVAKSIKNSIAIADGKVFAQDVTGMLYAVNCNDGTIAWQEQLPIQPVPGLIDGLTAKGDTVFAGSGEGLTAYDARTGKALWRNTGWRRREGTTSTLAAGCGVVVGGSQWDALYGNDDATGRKLWSLSEEGLRDRGATPAFYNGLIYIVSNHSFFIIEPKSGTIIARRKLPTAVDATSTPLLADGKIIFGTSKEGLLAIDAQTFEPVWNAKTGDALVYTVPYTRPESSTVESNPTIANGIIYVAASDGGIYGIRPKDGEIVWHHATGAPIFSSVAVSGDKLVANDFGGNIYMFALPTE